MDPKILGSNYEDTYKKDPLPFMETAILVIPYKMIRRRQSSDPGQSRSGLT